MLAHKQFIIVKMQHLLKQMQQKSIEIHNHMWCDNFTLTGSVEYYIRFQNESRTFLHINVCQ